jgi:hypothetical protein
MPSTHIDFDGDGDDTADGEVLGGPEEDGVPVGESGGVPGELGLGAGLPLVLAVALGEGVAVLPPLPCLPRPLGVPDVVAEGAVTPPGADALVEPGAAGLVRWVGEPAPAAGLAGGCFAAGAPIAPETS